MKCITILTCVAFIFACYSCEQKGEKKVDRNVAASSSDAKANTDEWEPVDSATAMKAIMEAGTPGTEHAMLAKWDGTWNAETTMWSTPDSPPQVSKSTCVNKMIFGGRYQQTKFKGKFGDLPFEGSSITGYDNAKKLFFTTWMDNISTGMMNMEGTWDVDTRSINFSGKMICPANGIECDIREVYKIIDDNTHVMETYGPDLKTGREFKGMQITFTRKG
jgi:hypothetical protein